MLMKQIKWSLTLEHAYKLKKKKKVGLFENYFKSLNSIISEVNSNTIIARSLLTFFS